LLDDQRLGRKEPNMWIIGVDYHPSVQQIAFTDTETGPEKAALAKRLGAHIYIDSAATDAAAELQKLGGAKAIIATATSGKAMAGLISGLGANKEIGAS
jgi:D-arabinose 1-dehydrogenase-like Zn-dependent alcohol dehydrogenase